MENLESIFKESQNIGTNKVYGKVEGDTLLYKGVWYAISYVTPECLVLNTDKLFGTYGDEFPLDLIK